MITINMYGKENQEQFNSELPLHLYILLHQLTPLQTIEIGTYFGMYCNCIEFQSVAIIYYEIEHVYIYIEYQVSIVYPIFQSPK